MVNLTDLLTYGASATRMQYQGNTSAIQVTRGIAAKYHCSVTRVRDTK